MESALKIQILGAWVDVETPRSILDLIKQKIEQRHRTIIANHNLHSLYLCKQNPQMAQFFEKADKVVIDSVPLILWARLMGHREVHRAHRVTYLDYRDDFWQAALRHGWHIYHIGGAPSVNPLSRQALLEKYPGARLSFHTGYFDMNGEANEILLEDIRRVKPHILMVGMGMPRQELWISQNLERLPHCVILPVGAAMDYEAGISYTPPRWTGQWGIEWLVRLCHEPKRLFSRYLFEPWFLIPDILKDILKRLGVRGLSQHPLP